MVINVNFKASDDTTLTHAVIGRMGAFEEDFSESLFKKSMNKANELHDAMEKHPDVIIAVMPTLGFAMRIEGYKKRIIAELHVAGGWGTFASDGEKHEYRTAWEMLDAVDKQLREN